MAIKQSLVGDLGGGVNALDQGLKLEDNQILVGKNVDLIKGGVRTRSGYTLFNHDSAKSGGIKYMMQAKFNDGTKQMIFANQDKWYYLTDAATTTTTWTLIGDYGDEKDNPRAFLYNNLVVMGSGNTSNNLKKWDGSSFANTSSQPSDNVNIFEAFQDRDISVLMAAEEGKNTLHWSDSIDANTWGSGVADSVPIPGDPSGIYGLKFQKGRIWATKRRSKYPVSVDFDQAASAYLPDVEKNVDGSGGCVAHDSIHVVTPGDVSDDIHMLAGIGEGIHSFGRPANYSELMGVSVSKLINPIVNQINWNKSTISRAIVWDRKYMLACPFGNSTYNNVVFVRHLDTGGWTVYYNWNVGAFCIFEDADGIDQLYIGDAIQPKIYKYDKYKYSDNIDGYSREVLTKPYDFGNFAQFKLFKYAGFFGFMNQNTKFLVDIIIDGQKLRTFEVTPDFIVNPGDGVTIGDNVWGEEVIGGTPDPGEKAFICRIPIDDLLTEGRTIQLGFYNSEPGMSWQINSGIFFIYDEQPFTYFPDQYEMQSFFN